MNSEMRLLYQLVCLTLRKLQTEKTSHFGAELNDSLTKYVDFFEHQILNDEV